jgi:hypothetical protein
MQVEKRVCILVSDVQIFWLPKNCFMARQRLPWRYVVGGNLFHRLHELEETYECCLPLVGAQIARGRLTE